MRNGYNAQLQHFNELLVGSHQAFLGWTIGIDVLRMVGRLIFTTGFIGNVSPAGLTLREHGF
jgi:hypothetical protein